MTRTEALAHARAIVTATDRRCRPTWRRASGTRRRGGGDHPARRRGGPVGGSIEDFTGDRPALYDIGQATERWRRRRRRRALPVPFILTARAENFLRGNRAWTTRSRACRPSSGPAPTCCSRPACPTSRRCGGLRGGVEAGQLHGRHPGQVVHGRRARGGRRQRISLATSLYRVAMTGLSPPPRGEDRGTFGYLDHACRRRS